MTGWSIDADCGCSLGSLVDEVDRSEQPLRSRAAASHTDIAPLRQASDRNVNKIKSIHPKKNTKWSKINSGGLFFWEGLLSCDICGSACFVRGGMIQTCEQYQFVHHVLSLYEKQVSHAAEE